MAKSKYAPALFEVINKRQDQSKGKSTLDVPKWWKTPGAPQEKNQEQPIGEEQRDAAETKPAETPAATSQAQQPASRSEQKVGREMAARKPDATEKTASAPRSASMAGAAAGTVSESAAPGATVRPAEKPSMRPASPARPGGTGSGPASTGRETTLFEVQDGRLNLSLTPTVAAIVGGVLLLMVFASFQLGRGTAGPPAVAKAEGSETTDPLESALNQPPDSSVLDIGATKLEGVRNQEDSSGGTTQERTNRAGSSSGTSNAQRAAASPSAPRTLAGNSGSRTSASTSTQRMPGLNYVIIQQFPLDHKESAEFIQAWLLENYDVATTLRRKSSSWQLVSLAGFDYSTPGDKEMCQQFIQDLKDIGSEVGKELIRRDMPAYMLTGPFAVKW
jgi:hypothetical protein